MEKGLMRGEGKERGETEAAGRGSGASSVEFFFVPVGINNRD
jgi:hypothetical protein